MASWEVVARDVPEFAAAVRERFDSFRHKTLATLRADGSPRISGIEASFADGELWLGMMPGSLKALDLKRDPRMALHSGSPDPEEEPTAWAGDAKISGRGIEVADPSQRPNGYREPDAVVFKVDIAEVVLTRVGDPPDHLVIESWHDGRGLRTVKRK